MIPVPRCVCIIWHAVSQDPGRSRRDPTDHQESSTARPPLRAAVRTPRSTCTFGVASSGRTSFVTRRLTPCNAWNNAVPRLPQCVVGCDEPATPCKPNPCIMSRIVSACHRRHRKFHCLPSCPADPAAASTRPSSPKVRCLTSSQPHVPADSRHTFVQQGLGQLLVCVAPTRPPLHSGVDASELYKHHRRCQAAEGRCVLCRKGRSPGGYRRSADAVPAQRLRSWHQGELDPATQPSSQACEI